ncbi:hypothetical protein ACOSQ4_011144 [Xanthoceras sorbifolium]
MLFILNSQCTHYRGVCNRGCTGGHYILAYTHMLKVGGVEASKDYPYTGIGNASYKFDGNKIIASIYSFQNIVADEDQYVANLVKYGTVAVAVNGDMLSSFMGGIVCAPCANTFNHAVTLVGYDLIVIGSLKILMEQILEKMDITRFVKIDLHLARIPLRLFLPLQENT